VTPSYLIDTNVLSEVIKPVPSPKVEAFLARPEDMWLSVVSLHEFACGLARMRDIQRRTRIEAWLEAIKESYADRVLPVDERIAETAGRVRGACETNGRTITPLDSLIGATALIHALTLATRNTRDFAALNLDVVNPWDE
jgi:toxin FitB